MKVPGTYGGHLELSAFAHLKRRNVKVVQPGLVYVIEWDAGGTTDQAASSGESSASGSGAHANATEERDKRRMRREKKREEAEADASITQGTVYVAYVFVSPSVRIIY
jgi:OTU domain-containing protein 3